MILVCLCTLVVCTVTFTSRNVPEHRLQWWLSDLEWDSKRSYTGEGIEIAVIDTGIDINHVDLRHSPIKEISNSIVNKEIDSLNHGTAVAGIIAAYPHDDNGLLGIAPNAKLISIKIVTDEYGRINVNDLVEAIDTAVSENVDIINISIGTLEQDKALENIINKASENNIIVVSSAGNYMEDDMLYPAKYNGVIAVGAKTRKNARISPCFEPKYKKVFYLPGDNIVTTISNDEYFSAYGTSFSTAMMTGIVALMLEKNAELTHEQIVNILTDVESNNNSISIPMVLREVSK